MPESTPPPLEPPELDAWPLLLPPLLLAPPLLDDEDESAGVCSLLHAAKKPATRIKGMRAWRTLEA